MAAANSIDDIIEIYKRDVDVTLIDECLKRTVEQRLQALQDFNAALDELRTQVARAAGRPKDFEAIAELEILRGRG